MVEWILISVFGSVFGVIVLYVLFRLASKAIIKSYFEEKINATKELLKRREQ